MIETTRMLGRERELELLREAERLHLLGHGRPRARSRTALASRAFGGLRRVVRGPLRALVPHEL